MDQKFEEELAEEQAKKYYSQMKFALLLFCKFIQHLKYLFILYFIFNIN